MASCLRLAVAVLIVAVFTVRGHSQNVTTGQCCGNCVIGPQGPPGIPGNNGIPGNSGVPGNHGFPGRDGAKGDRGELGPPGRNGTKGDRGDQGPTGGAGTKGDRGDQGPPGVTGSPGIYVSAPRNVKQCHWNNLDSQAESGAIVACPFNKLSSSSTLRLTWNGALRVFQGGNSGIASCKRWFFTLNGTECSDPAPIDGIMYMNYGNSYVNNHRVSTIDGLCHGVPNGPVAVALNIGACVADGVAEGLPHTGYNSISRIIVEELDI